MPLDARPCEVDDHDDDETAMVVSARDKKKMHERSISAGESLFYSSHMRLLFPRPK